MCIGDTCLFLRAAKPDVRLSRMARGNWRVPKSCGVRAPCCVLRARHMLSARCAGPGLRGPKSTCCANEITSHWSHNVGFAQHSRVLSGGGMQPKAKVKRDSSTHPRCTPFMLCAGSASAPAHSHPSLRMSHPARPYAHAWPHVSLFLRPLMPSSFRAPRASRPCSISRC